MENLSIVVYFLGGAILELFLLAFAPILKQRDSAPKTSRMTISWSVPKLMQ